MTAASASVRHPASLRDPSGYVAVQGGEVRRIVTQAGIDDFEAVEKTKVLERLIRSGRLWPYEPSGDSFRYPEFYGFAPARTLSHPPLPFVSYPYEWSFNLLKTAAIAHLELHLEALQSGVTLKDASAYNIQFVGVRPVFIDLLSFRPYRPGEYWSGHDQFCRQFLAPLILESCTGVSPSSWYRGSPDGLSPSEVLKFLPWRKKLQPLTLMNMLLPAHLASNSKKSGGEALQQAKKRSELPRKAYENLLSGLLRGIRHLPRHKASSTWANYTPTTSYGSAAAKAKEGFIRKVVGNIRPRQLLDIGCNDGYYSAVAIKAGAESVVGLEADRGAVDYAFDRAANDNLNFLPLFVNFANPTPAQGWANSERDSLKARAKPDFAQALAVLHHLTLSLNIPLREVVDVILDFAPAGILEFVPLSDPMAKRLAAGREDLFANYTVDNFRDAIRQRASILEEIRLPDSDRVLAHYQRHRAT